MDLKVIMNSMGYTIKKGIWWFIGIIIVYHFIFNERDWENTTAIIISSLEIGFFLGHSAGSSFEFLERISKRVVFIIILGSVIFISTFISNYYLNYTEECGIYIFQITWFSVFGIINSISDGIKFRRNRDDEKNSD